MMILRTRKEQYLNEIVGNGNTAPGTPYTREELFFADILGEVNAPSPITRAEKYLAKIANKYSGELPEPKTRIEKFIARAAGMDVTIPTPITREEMFWADYTLVVEKEISGIPPLTFKAKKAGTLKNYRIYGQMSRNLFNFNTVTNGYRITWATGALISDETAIMSDFIPVKENVYQINIQAFVACYNSEKNYLGIYSSNGYIKDYSNSVNSFTIDNNCKYVRIFTFRNKSTPVALTQETMLNSGSTLLPYEPYGESVGDLVTSGDHAGEYKVPVTVSDGTDTLTTPIYLPEPIKMVGDEAEYIDYAEQKMHRIGADDIDVTLPELPVLPGTNTLTVGTEVQPSKVYIKYEGAR